MKTQIALVTGANRGIGFSVCKQLCEAEYEVIFTSRNEKRAQSVYQDLKNQGFNIHFNHLDLNDLTSIKTTIEYIRKKFKRIDILINNAAIASDARYSALDIPMEKLQEIFQVNFFGTCYLSQLCIPLMQKNNYGRIVNVSSGRGSFTRLTKGRPGGPAYRASKTALNAFTCLFADQVKDFNILVNAVTPGKVKTRLTGFTASKLPEEAAKDILWLATLPENGPNGCFFKDKEIFPW